MTRQRGGNLRDLPRCSVRPALAGRNEAAPDPAEQDIERRVEPQLLFEHDPRAALIPAEQQVDEHEAGSRARMAREHQDRVGTGHRGRVLGVGDRLLEREAEPEDELRDEHQCAKETADQGQVSVLLTR